MRRFSAAILIASDRSHKGTRRDETGPALREYLVSLGYDVTFLEVVPDDRQSIVSVLQQWVREDEVNLILVSGGTGPAPRDVTPEATLDVIERRIPGMEEAMRRVSFEKTPFAVLSRAVVGFAGVAVPGAFACFAESAEQPRRTASASIARIEPTVFIASPPTSSTGYMKNREE